MSERHTPGPWAWMGNGSHDLYLATTHSGRQYVMGFRRMGLQGAQPVFRAKNRMVPASELMQFEVGDRSVVGIKAAHADGSVYRYDVRGIANADARLIAAAPDLLEALEELHLKSVVGTDDERHAALNKAWAAIHKARDLDGAPEPLNPPKEASRP